MLGNGNVRVSKGFPFPRGLPFPRFFGNGKAAENLGLLNFPIIVKSPILALPHRGNGKPKLSAAFPFPRPFPRHYVSKGSGTGTSS